MSDEPTVFYDLPPDKFPVRVRIFELADNPDVATPAWETTLEDVGILRIPGFGRDMRCVMTFGDGSASTYPPAGTGDT